MTLTGTGETPEIGDPIKITVSVRYNNGEAKPIYEIPVRISELVNAPETGAVRN
jgi:hypothetical protein